MVVCSYCQRMVTIILLGAVVVLLAASGLCGAESRPGFDERPEGSRFGALS